MWWRSRPVYCAQAALDTARNLHTDSPERAHRQALAAFQAELLHIRVALNRISAERGRIRDATGAAPHDLDSTIANAAGTLTQLDDTITRIHHQLASRQPGSAH
jgi:hypothetical protein